MTSLTEPLAPARQALAADGDPGADIGRLTMSCLDGPGIIASVTGFLHRHGANIVQSDQYSTGPTGGQFFLRTEFELPGSATGGRAGAQLRGRGRARPGRVVPAQRRGRAGARRAVRLAGRPLPARPAVAGAPGRAAHRHRHGHLEPPRPASRTSSAFGVPFTHIPVTRDTKPQAEQRQLELLRGRVDLVVLARYMQILSAGFLRPGRRAGHQHPSLVPARVRRRGARTSRATSAA